jgi:hypothetical protein
MLLNVAAHNVSIRNIEVSKGERHIMFSVTKHTYFFNAYVMCTFHFVMVHICDAVHYVTFMF